MRTVTIKRRVSMADKAKEKTNELIKVIGTVVQAATFLVPLGAAFQLGLPDLTKREMLASALLLASVGIAYGWLRHNRDAQ